MLKKIFKNKKSDGASALLAAIILIGISGLIIAGSASVIRPMQRYFGQRNKGADMRSLSEEGLQLALRDLLERAKLGDWTNMKVANQSLPIQTLVNMGLVITSQSEDRAEGYIKRTEVLPRFSREKQDSSIMKIYYLPLPENADANGGYANYSYSFPKLFKVVIESRKSGSADIESLEALVEVKMRTPGDYAISFVENHVSPGLYSADDVALNPAPYRFIPSIFDGDVYLGKIHPDNFFFDESFHSSDSSWSSVPTPSNIYNFKRHTTIGQPEGAIASIESNVIASGLGVGFSMDNYEEEVELEYLLDSELKLNEWMGRLEDEADEVLLGSDICLKVVGDQVQKWDCEVNTSDPLKRYVGEYSGAPLAVNGTPLSTYTITPLGLKLFANGNVHLKGAINGQLGIVTKGYFWIEGDIQYQDQSASSDDILTVLAKEGVRVPSTVPNHKFRYFDNLSLSQLGLTTNTKVAGDRDSGNVDYQNSSLTAGAAVGSENSFSTLDLDGCFTSFGDLEITPIAQSPDFINDKFMTVWNQHTNPQYYYTGSGKHKKDPAVCGVNDVEPDACPEGEELKRNYSDAIWVFGCMSFEKPSALFRTQEGAPGRNGIGFQKVYIKSDDRLKSFTGYGIASFKYPKANLIWSRRLNKKSELLANALADTQGDSDPGGQ